VVLGCFGFNAYLNYPYYNQLVMAIIKNGVNGTVSGKAGSVVFVLTKTGNYVRSLPRVKKTSAHS